MSKISVTRLSLALYADKISSSRSDVLFKLPHIHISEFIIHFSPFLFWRTTPEPTISHSPPPSPPYRRRRLPATETQTQILSAQIFPLCACVGAVRVFIICIRNRFGTAICKRIYKSELIASVPMRFSSQFLNPFLLVAVILPGCSVCAGCELVFFLYSGFQYHAVRYA